MSPPGTELQTSSDLKYENYPNYPDWVQSLSIVFAEFPDQTVSPSSPSAPENHELMFQLTTLFFAIILRPRPSRAERLHIRVRGTEKPLSAAALIDTNRQSARPRTRILMGRFVGAKLNAIRRPHRKSKKKNFQKGRKKKQKKNLA